MQGAQQFADRDDKECVLTTQHKIVTRHEHRGTVTPGTNPSRENITSLSLWYMDMKQEQKYPLDKIMCSLVLVSLQAAYFVTTINTLAVLCLSQIL
jgi:hypothetical protein